MFDFQQKNKMRKILYSRPAVVVVLCIAFYFLYSTWSIYQKLLQSKEKVRLSQGELLALSTKSMQLDAEISELQTREGIEKEIRSKFGQAKPGEQMAVIVSDKGSSTASTPIKQSFFVRLKNFLDFNK